MDKKKRIYNGPYTAEYLAHVAFPLGGIGAGTICMEGNGCLSHVSLRGEPEFFRRAPRFERLTLFNDMPAFAALCVLGEPNVALALEGPVPEWKVYGPPGTANGGYETTYGLPRFADASMLVRFPFATIHLEDHHIPLEVELTGWSPFTPGDADSSSLPAAGLEYCFRNPTDHPVEAIFSYHAWNMMATGDGGDAVLPIPGGFILDQPQGDGRPTDQGAFAITVDDTCVKVNRAWFRGRRSDVLSMLWQSVARGDAPAADQITAGDPSPGGSLAVPFTLQPGEERTIRLSLTWYVPETGIRQGLDAAPDASGSCGCSSCCDDGCAPSSTHRPWYAGAFDSIQSATAFWHAEYDRLREESARFSACFYDTTLAPEVVEAAAANLAILKTPTVLRQTDGRLWCWEGCHDNAGCCPGSCTHVWNYAQALPHLFPELERSLRQTEYCDSQDASGHQMFRAGLPIRPVLHNFHAAADGQLGGIIKVYRDWRISGDTDWLRGLWPRVKQSLDYCIETWDPNHDGWLVEPHHNTYDIEFWGPDGMCTSFYLGALQAALGMAEALGDSAPLYQELLDKGSARMESDLWNGEYFIQKVEWESLRAGDPTKYQSFAAQYSDEAIELLRREGPKYQYGNGCLTDGVLGAWMAATAGVPGFLNQEKVKSHLLAVHRHNLKQDLFYHFNPVRPTYALGHEAGLLLCTWPQGSDLTLPFYFAYEVWTGIEYQAASHLMLMGCVAEGLEIVRAVRDRYDGRVRDPFDEYECGHWYARAMASYGLLQGLTGVRYDAVERTLVIAPNIKGDFRTFLSTTSGYGTVGVRDGKPFVEVKQGKIPYERIAYTACA